MRMIVVDMREVHQILYGSSGYQGPALMAVRSKVLPLTALAVSHHCLGSNPTRGM